MSHMNQLSHSSGTPQSPDLGDSTPNPEIPVIPIALEQGYEEAPHKVGTPQGGADNARPPIAASSAMESNQPDWCDPETFPL